MGNGELEMIQKINEHLPGWLLRLPLAIVFIQQGLSKLPIAIEDAQSFDLPYIVWWFVTFGEIGAAIGLLLGGVIGVMPWHRWFSKFMQTFIWNIGDLITRFSGITMTCVVTGVIWLMSPSSFWDVIWRDYLHVSLYVGGLYFALRGNAKYGV